VTTGINLPEVFLRVIIASPVIAWEYNPQSALGAATKALLRGLQTSGANEASPQSVQGMVS
jgi:hypothetical protein